MLTESQRNGLLVAIWLLLFFGLCGIIEWSKPRCPFGAELSYSNGWHCEVPFIKKG